MARKKTKDELHGRAVLNWYEEQKGRYLNSGFIKLEECAEALGLTRAQAARGRRWAEKYLRCQEYPFVFAHRRATKKSPGGIRLLDSRVLEDVEDYDRQCAYGSKTVATMTAKESRQRKRWVFQDGSARADDEKIEQAARVLGYVLPD